MKHDALIAGLELFGSVWPRLLVKVVSPGPQWHVVMRQPPPRYRGVLARNLGYATKAWLAETFLAR